LWYNDFIDKQTELINMNLAAIQKILNAAADLTVEEQLVVNKGLCEMIRQSRKIKLAVAGTAFVPGDVVRFNAKSKGMKHIKIEKFNRAGTAVVGHECDAKGTKLPMATRWTVANTLCTKAA
jgi:hypothetical protein